MKKNIRIIEIINTSIITAFTIAAALIWKDVISDSIKAIVPPGEQLFYKFIAAVITTVIVVISIYIILKTESRAEKIFKKFKKNR